ncbi:MAG TPA: dihydrolipoamide acetyltransferase family protein [Anaerolineales bacterium]|nr:dihydrolipoamide acetyltransferase family protein [Anaerolineales bacterium]
MPTKVIMPQLGESIVEGTVVKWLKGPGEKIANLESLLEVETDKVVSEIPSPAEGVLLAALIPEGTTVKVGTVIGWIGRPGEKIPESDKPAAAAQPEKAMFVPTETGATGPVEAHELGFISPVVAKIAREKKVDLQRVKGTGQGGRITKKDVLAFLEAGPQAGAAIWETPADGDLFRPTELVFAKDDAAKAQGGQAPAMIPGNHFVPHTTIRKQIAERMVFSKTTAPHVTTVMEADLSRVAAHREASKAAFARDGANLTYTAYLVAATVTALKAYPMVNSSWEETGLRIHPAISIGMATSLGEEGLIVPVIKNADGLSLLGIARAVNDLAERARSHRLQADEVKDGTFTITNHGVTGSLFATPIINQPQCAILGVGLIQKRVVVINDAIAIRPMVYLSLTFDHRILDGASADRFLSKVVDCLENWA